MDYGKDSYTTVNNVQTYLDRTLTANEQAILNYVIPAASRWIDRTLGSCFDNLDESIPASWTKRYYAGGKREINIHPCQQITKVEAINPYDFSVWYTYAQPLEYTQEPYNLTVKTSLRMRLNEFTGNDLKWPADGNLESIAVTALFTEYDYTAADYPADIKLLCNHISAVFLQNNQNAEPVQRESIEGHLVIKRIDDLLLSDPMVSRIVESRQEVWLEEM